MNGQKVKMLLTEYTLVYGSHVYLFTLPSAEASHEKCMTDFRRLVSGFERLDAGGGR